MEAEKSIKPAVNVGTTPLPAKAPLVFASRRQWQPRKKVERKKRKEKNGVANFGGCKVSLQPAVQQWPVRGVAFFGKPLELLRYRTLFA